jgi:hypothetical protein
MIFEDMSFIPSTFCVEDSENLFNNTGEYDFSNNPTNENIYQNVNNFCLTNSKKKITNTKEKVICNQNKIVCQSISFQIKPQKNYKKIDIIKNSIKNETPKLLNKKHGRKKKDSNEKGDRDKNAKDNIEKKIKTIFFKFCMDPLIKDIFNINRKFPYEIKIDNNKVLKEVFFDHTINEIYCLQSFDYCGKQKEIADMKMNEIFQKFIDEEKFNEFKNYFNLQKYNSYNYYINLEEREDEEYAKQLKKSFEKYLEMLSKGQTRINRKEHQNLIERLKKSFADC